MEVLEMLKQQGNTLTNEELKFLIDELRTGSYNEDYKNECFEIISQIKSDKSHDVKKSKETLHTVILTPEEIKDRLDKSALSVDDRFFRDLEVARMVNSSDQVVEKYINEHTLSDEFFITNLNRFNDLEVRKIFALIKLNDKQIEELFTTVPSGTIEKNQYISEEFFIKHFDDIDIKALKKNKVTNWIIDPTQRSKKIIIFLKMKGVKL